MGNLFELLYLCWIGEPDPKKWPEHLQDFPIRGHGQYAFREGICLGLQLATAAFYSEQE